MVKLKQITVRMGKMALDVEIERRAFSGELRAIESDGSGKETITGYAALFDVVSEDLGGFKETIRSGAFSEAVEEDDVRALFNHDPNIVLGRNKGAGTLRLKEDLKGLAVEIDPPDTQAARDLILAVKRGDISQMSFAFILRRRTADSLKNTVEPDSWEWLEDGTLMRTINKVMLYDVSLVTFPAYRDTSVAIRSLDRWKSGQMCGEVCRRKLRLLDVEKANHSFILMVP